MNCLYLTLFLVFRRVRFACGAALRWSVFLLVLLGFFGWEGVWAGDFQSTVEQAAAIIRRFKDLPEDGIPEAVFRDAKGLAVLQVVKAGFLFSGRGGEGLVVARTAQGWSGPSAIVLGGIGYGFQVGVQVTEFVFVLNTPEAVKAFAQKANFTLGGDISASAGPVGRTAEGGVMPLAAIYTYSRSQGIFGGLSVEGAVVAAAPKTNEAYYGRPVTPAQILYGDVPPPRGARVLLDALEAPYRQPSS